MLWKFMFDILLIFNFQKFLKVIKIIVSKIIRSESIYSYSMCFKKNMVVIWNGISDGIGEQNIIDMEVIVIFKFGEK